MTWSITAAASGTTCRTEGRESPYISVAAYRVNDAGQTAVLIAPSESKPEWVSLEALGVLNVPK